MKLLAGFQPELQAAFEPVKTACQRACQLSGGGSELLLALLLDPLTGINGDRTGQTAQSVGGTGLQSSPAVGLFQLRLLNPSYAADEKTGVELGGRGFI